MNERTRGNRETKTGAKGQGIERPGGDVGRERSLELINNSRGESYMMIHSVSASFLVGR
jgi:hypothetical protein